MLSEEDCLAGPCCLNKDRETRFELMLPVHDEAEGINVEGEAPLGIGDSQLRNDGLLQSKLLQDAQR